MEPQDTFVRCVDVELNEGRAVTLSVHQQEVGDVGCVVWDAALVLAYYLQTEKAKTKHILNKNALELGSGTGVVGLVAASCGAREVVLTDLPELIPLMRKNITVNSIAWESLKTTVKALPYRWGNDEDLECILKDHSTDEGQPKTHNFDCILVADCVYYRQAVLPLAQSINDLIVRGKCGVTVLCSYEDRDTSDKRELQEEFRKILSDTFQLKIDFVPFTEMHHEFRSSDIHIFSVSKRR